MFALFIVIIVIFVVLKPGHAVVVGIVSRIRVGLAVVEIVVVKVVSHVVVTPRFGVDSWCGAIRAYALPPIRIAPVSRAVV